jgi:D-alanyl-lipoteichoic acid acyltransferase DltB (MBOAT superfamily)
MSFNSFVFAVFAPIVILLYFSLRGRSRLILLLAASYLFYAWWDWRFVSLLVFSSVIDYHLGIGIEEARGNRSKQRRLLILSLVSNLGLLSIFKYLNFFLDSTMTVLHYFDPGLSAPSLEIILPVGISFFTFQTMSYSIDLYRGVIERSERDFVRFSVYVAMFPQLVAGPIVRAARLIPELRIDQRFDSSRVIRGLELVLWGFFLKLCLADTAATVVEPRFDHILAYGSLEHILGVVCFAFQIYGDFAGYSLIAIGLGRILGFDFGVNFDSPYFSRGFSEFWRRWHISLSSWLRDYLYISLGGNRGGTWRTYRNLALTMLLGGLWHGAAFTFIIWGALHGFYLIVQRVTGSAWGRLCAVLRAPAFVVGAVELILVFSLTCLAWVFFRSATLADAMTMLRVIGSLEDLSLHSGHQLIGLSKTFFLIGVVCAVDLLGRSERVRTWYMGSHPTRFITALCLIWAICLLGTFQGASFLYFQF